MASGRNPDSVMHFEHPTDLEEDSPDLANNLLQDFTSTLKDKPSQNAKGLDGIKQRLEALIIENKHRESPMKKFLFVSAIVASCRGHICLVCLQYSQRSCWTWR